jgi:ribosomal protein L28
MTDRAGDRSLSTWYDAEAILEVLKESCPALEELSFSAAGARIPLAVGDGRASATIETVTTVGVEIGTKYFQFSKKICKEFFTSALSWARRKQLPNLQTVRFISELNLLHVQRCHAKRLDDFLQECSLAGIVVQDSFRTPLNSGQSQVSGSGPGSNSPGDSILEGA